MKFFRKIFRKKTIDITEAKISKEEALNIARVECESGGYTWWVENTKIRPIKGYWIVETGYSIRDSYKKIKIDWKTGEAEIVEAWVLKRRRS